MVCQNWARERWFKTLGPQRWSFKTTALFWFQYAVSYLTIILLLSHGSAFPSSPLSHKIVLTMTFTQAHSRVTMISMQTCNLIQAGRVIFRRVLCKLSSLGCFITVCIRQAVETLLSVQRTIFPLLWLVSLFLVSPLHFFSYLLPIHHQNLKYASEQAAYVTVLQTSLAVYFLPDHLSHIHA